MTNHNQRHWTQSEIGKLKRLWAETHNKDLQKIFNRTYESIRIKANRIGLPKKERIFIPPPKKIYNSYTVTLFKFDGKIVARRNIKSTPQCKVHRADAIIWWTSAFELELRSGFYYITVINHFDAWNY